MILGDTPLDYCGAEEFTPKKVQTCGLEPWRDSQVKELAEVLRTTVQNSVIRCAALVGKGGLISAMAKISARSDLAFDIDFDHQWLNPRSDNKFAVGKHPASFGGY